jgi:ATP-dependent DNA ligase
VTFPEYAEYSDAEGIMTMTSPAGEFGYELIDECPQRTMIELAKDLGWEGWVVVDPNATYGDKAYNFRGKNDRPKECVKDKPKREADFIVRYDPKKGIGKKGEGAKAIGIGSAQAYLVHPELGEIKIAYVGNGLTKEQVVEFANPKLYPMVWQVEFEDWTKDGSLTHPRFVRIRDDKKPKECTVDQNPSWEEHYAQA